MSEHTHGMIFYIICNKKHSLCRILTMNSTVIPTFKKVARIECINFIEMLGCELMQILETNP